MSASRLPSQAAEHWEGAAKGKLLLPHCRVCEHVWFPPARQCPKCLSAEVDWCTASPHGVVVGWSVFHRAYFPDLPGLAPPYTVILVRLDAGPLLYSNPGDLKSVPPIGTRLTARFVPAGGGEALVRFDPAGAVA